MMANKLVQKIFLRRQLPVNIAQARSYSGDFHDERLVIGKREWVGYGVNSTPHYSDRVDYPMPAIRFKEITGDLVALKEKEKGDWKKLSLEEKKQLYRASFCQTFAEMNAPTGEWKSVLGWTLFFVSLGFWFMFLEKQFLYKPLPSSFSEESRAAQLRRMLDLRVGHLTGLSSKWDYEKDDWKKSPKKRQTSALT